MADDVLPMTEAQLGLLVVNRSIPVPHLYNITAELELDPRWPPHAVASGFADVLAVQPALRLRLGTGLDRRAELLDPPPADRVLTQEAVDTAELDVRRRALLAELGTLPVIEQEPPLLRARHLTATDGSRSVLLFVVHHNVFDGYSLRPLVTDLNAALAGTLDVTAVRAGRESALRAELDAQLRAATEAEDRARELAARVIAHPATVLYPRPGRPRTTRRAADTVRLALSTEESAAIDRLRATLSTTPFTVFGAVFAAVLSRHTGNRSVCFGTPLSARRTSRSFDLCGFFVNTLPITLDVPWSKPFAEFATAKVASELIDVMSHSEIPLTAIARHLGRGHSVFSVLFTAQENVEPMAGAPVRAALLHGNGTAKFDLQVSVLRTGGTWALDFEHDRDTLPDPVVAAIVESMRGALSRAADQPDLPLDLLFADVPQPGTHEVIDISGHRAPVGVPGQLGRGSQQALWDERGSLVLLDTPEQPAAPAASDESASGDAVEEDVRRLWSELLGCQVPVDESLVTYGAHSLNVLAAVELLEDRYGVSVPILDFFADPTVRTLAAAIRAAQC